MTQRNAKPVAALLSIAPLAWVAGCAVGPDFKAPVAPAVARVTAQPLPAQTVATNIAGGEAQAFVDGKALPDRWWTLFQSEALNAIVDEALRANPTLVSAQAALRTAQANYRAQVSALFPSADAHFNATRQKIDTGSFGNPGGGGVIYNLYNASVGVSYGLDFWGGTRRGVEASAAAREAKAYELDAAYQTLIANVVTTVIQISLNNCLIAGAQLNVQDQVGRLEIARKQLALGARSKTDLLAIESALSTEQATLPTAERSLYAARSQLAVYLNKTPGESLPADIDLFALKLPAEIPVSLPSELVRQRPDIRASEALLHQAAANIGVATANLLPQVALSASIGTQATVLDQLFTGNIFSVGAAVTQPLFHAGELTAKRRAAIATFDQAAADYRQTVLLAFKNVADSLQAIDSDAKLLNANDAVAQTAEGIYQTTVKQRQIGTASLFDELQARTNWTKARTSYAYNVGARLQDSAALFQALGGTWSQALAATPSAQVSSSSDKAARQLSNASR